MKLIAITPEQRHDREVEFITTLLDRGFDYVHLRRPSYSEAEMRHFIGEIPARYRSRIKLHGHFDLAIEYGLGGVHLNSRAAEVPACLPPGMKVSRSCHSTAELAGVERYEYLFLSPIFDSISKPGYASHFADDELIALFRHSDLRGKVVALGGVTAERLPWLRQTGFAGAAFLGYIFGSTTINELIDKIDQIKCYNSSPIQQFPR